MHRHKRSIVHQRELHSDTPSFALALRAALRQAPKVILVGEMRDKETIEIALEAAETGHLVLSTLHTIDASKTVERIIGAFPMGEQHTIRNRLAKSFRAIVSQRLIPRKDGNGRVAIVEILKSTLRTREYVEKGEQDGKTLLEAMIDGDTDGMQHFDGEIEKLIRVGSSTSVPASPMPRIPGTCASANGYGQLRSRAIALPGWGHTSWRKRKPPRLIESVRGSSLVTLQTRSYRRYSPPFRVRSPQKHPPRILHPHARLPPRPRSHVVNHKQMIFDDQNFLLAHPSHQRRMRHKGQLAAESSSMLFTSTAGNSAQRLANPLRLFGIRLSILRQLNRLVRLRRRNNRHRHLSQVRRQPRVRRIETHIVVRILVRRLLVKHA